MRYRLLLTLLPSVCVHASLCWGFVNLWWPCSSSRCTVRFIDRRCSVLWITMTVLTTTLGNRYRHLLLNCLIYDYENCLFFSACTVAEVSGELRWRPAQFWYKQFRGDSRQGMCCRSRACCLSVIFSGVPRRQSHRHSGLATLPYVGAIL